MAEQPNTIDIDHPPVALLRLVNPIVGLLLRTPLVGPLRKYLMTLTFTGRKTGRRFSLPVSAHLIDNELYALTESRWKQNFRDGAISEVRYDGSASIMRGELIRDRATVSELLWRCVQSYGVTRAQLMLGLKFRNRDIPTLEEWNEAVDRLDLAAIRFTSAE